MSTHLVSYDLSAPGRDYSTLHTFLKSQSSWARVLESVWYVDTSLSTTALRDKLKSLIDANDHLLVVNVGRAALAWYNLDNEVASWFHKRAA